MYKIFAILALLVSTAHAETNWVFVTDGNDGSQYFVDYDSVAFDSNFNIHGVFLSKPGDVKTDASIPSTDCKSLSGQITYHHRLPEFKEEHVSWSQYDNHIFDHVGVSLCDIGSAKAHKEINIHKMGVPI